MERRTERTDGRTDRKHKKKPQGNKTEIPFMNTTKSKSLNLQTVRKETVPSASERGSPSMKKEICIKVSDAK